MIDLSHLTEDEQEMILEVLKRDAELKKSDEQRIKQLRKTERDRGRLKYLTGEWFYETKYHRHRDRIHGSDIIRASMKRKPVTLLEITQRWSEKPSSVYGPKRDVYIPPELSGLIEDPQSHNDRVDDESQQETQRPQVKPRQNPFNIFRLQRDEVKPINAVKEAKQTPAEGHHEPQSSQVSNIHTSTEEAGKTTELSTEVKTDKVTVEEDRSILKVFDWFGKGSRDGKLKELPTKKELNEEEPKPDESLVTKSDDSEAPDVHLKTTKPVPKPRRGLFAMFSRAENKDKNPEVQASEKAKCETEANDNILEQISFPTENRMAEILQDENKPDKLCEEPSQQERFDQDEVSTGRLVNLKSFWERGDRGPKILSMKKEDEEEESETSQLNENYHNTTQSDMLSDSSTSLSKPKLSDPEPADVESTLIGSSLISPRRTSNGVAISLLEDEEPFILDNHKASENSSSKLHTLVEYNALDSDQQEESICRDISDLKKEISTLKISISQHEDKVSINDLKSFWEKEKGGLRVIVSSQTCTANVKDPSPEPSPNRSLGRLSEPQFDIRSNNPSSPDRRIFKEFNLIEQKLKMEKVEDKQRSENTVPLQDLQDIRGRVPHIMQNLSNIEQFIADPHSSPSPPSSPLRSLSPKGQHDKPHYADIYQPKDRDQTRTPSPLRQFKVPCRDSYPSKESTKDGSPLKTFPIDINPANTSSCSVRLKPGQTSMYTSPEHRRKTSDGGSDTRSILTKERKLSLDSLTRFYIPLSLHHYLGLPKKAALKETEQVKAQAGEMFEQVHQGGVSNESSPSRHSLLESEEITFDSSGSSTPEAWSISHASSYWDSEDDGPFKAALERANARPISISKSLEDLASTPSQRWKTDPRNDVRMSMENVSAVPPNTKTSFSDPEQVKMMSLSVPALMQQEVTGSVMSIYSSEFGYVEVKGTVQFAIHYVQKLGEFHIFVVQCKDLAVADVKRNRSDPYVKCYLLPDKAKYGKKKTCVRKKTLDPTYNEILRFKIPMEMLKTQKLNISVWHNDTFGRNSFLGEVEVDLAEWDFNNTQMNEYLLKGRVQIPTSPKHSFGGEEMSAEIKVALRFLPQTTLSHKNKGNGEVQIWVKECKNLPISRGVAIDPFVKCAILPENNRKSRQKTRVLKRAPNPVFNHTMVYDGFGHDDLKDICVELTVWDHDRLNNHFIGGIRLGPGTGKSYGSEVNWMDSNVAEAALWERMVQTQNEWVEDTLPLRMMVMARMSR
ncbi:synaptotagmin-like protein 2 isoform X11 [Danio rerio]|uniref:Synaptotagmin-like protein 2 isoform X11 n=1 Tax=Danio rerio TaxID=7955 RepID=A0AC58GMR3_DANRE